MLPASFNMSMAGKRPVFVYIFIFKQEGSKAQILERNIQYISELQNSHKRGPKSLTWS